MKLHGILFSLIMVLALVSPAEAVSVLFPPTTDTYPHNCQIVADVELGADGGLVYFTRGDFFVRDGVEYFGSCGNSMGVSFSPAGTGASVTLLGLTATSNIEVVSDDGSATYQLSYGNSLTVSANGPTSGFTITMLDANSAAVVSAVSVASQLVNTVPGDIQFDITDATPANDRRVLLSNTHVVTPATTPSYPYPYYQGLLGKDRAIPINLRVLYGGAGTAGIPVTLRIIDPPDTSEYIVGGNNFQGQPLPGSQRSFVGDNHGPAPAFHGNCVPCATFAVTSDSSGAIQVELDLDAATAAGDNYEIEATAMFPNHTTKTVRSGTITAWKRMFVEKKPMFRRGAPLATDAPAGVTNLIVHQDITSSAGDVFHDNDQLLLLHAPQFGASKASANAFYEDFARIAGRPRPFTAADPAPGPGTIETDGTVTVIGHHARFNALNSGDVISVAGETRYVVAVTSSQGNESLTVDRPFAFIGTAGDGQPQAYYVGDPNLVDRGRRAYLRLPLAAPLPRSYGRELSVPVPSGVLTLNDAVAQVAGTTLPPSPDDYYASEDDLLTGAAEAQPGKVFPSAYTEYIVLPWQPSPAAGDVVPREVLGTADAYTQWFIDKWFGLPTPTRVRSTDPNPLLGVHYVTPPNHQLILVGDTTSTTALTPTTPLNDAYLSYSVTGELASVLNRGTVEYLANRAGDGSPLKGADVGNLLKRTVVHELTHQWEVNGGPGSANADHCYKEVAYTSTAAYPSPSVVSSVPTGLEFCLMTKADVGPSMPAPWNSTLNIDMVQYCYRFGFTHYHVVQSGSQWESEYLEIRARTDPWTP